MEEIKFRQAIWENGKFFSWHYWGYKNGLYQHPVNSNKSYQYMGVKDKNGKEIFDGDICKDNDSTDIVVVKFFDGAFWFCFDDDTRFTYDWIRKQVKDWHCEVISNIEENPDGGYDSKVK